MCAWVMRLWVLLWLSVVGGAWGAWRQGQRSHTLSLLPRNSTMRLCRDFSDPSRFQRILAPINVERIVATEGHRRVGEFIKSEMDSLGWHTEWDAFEDNTPYGRKPFRNLIATQDPHASRRLVLACHYDSKIFPGQVFLGSTDSAVPCAMMIDIAHTLTPYMYGRAAQNVSLQLVFFDGEEAYVNWSETDSTYGSRHLAAKWEKQWYPTQSQYNPLELSRELDRIDVLMLLDLIGAANPMFHNAANLGATKLFTELPRIEQSLRSIGCLSRQQRNVFGERVMQVGVEDDHIPFMKRGVPILHLISVPFPTVWHKLSDDTSALHFPTIHYVESIVRVFVAKYLGIAPL